MHNFLKRHNITILDDTKRCESVLDKTVFFSNPKNMEDADINYEKISEPLYTIQIPESHLKWFNSLENQVFESTITGVVSDYSRHLLSTMITKQIKEREMRNKFPALQSAFETYSLFLHLCNKE